MLSEIVTANATPTAAEAAITSPEVTTPETASPTAEAEQQHEESGAPKKDSVVPYGALHEERQRRKQWESDAKAKDAQLQQFVAIQAQRDQEWQVAQQRMQQILAAQYAQPVPDKQADPIAYMAHQAEQTQAEVQALRRQQWERDQAQQYAQQQQYEQQRQQQVVHQFVNRVTTSEAQFKEQHPDYHNALTFAVDRRTKELHAAGWDEDKAREIAGDDARNLAVQWVQRGQNPAAMAYAMAQAMGYQPTAANAEQMHDEGYKASKPSGGGAARGKVSVRQIANMSPTQLARMSDEEFKAAMGG
jgi:hypothetical protein